MHSEYFAMPSSHEDLITVITVNLNNREGLEKTIQSVAGQVDVNREFIVIDGGSSDGSQDVIRNCAQIEPDWISEPDRGIYDAMNKGVRRAKGEWIIFMNSGDVFYDRRTMARLLARTAGKECVAVYGDSLADYGNFTVFRPAGAIRDLWKGMVFSHQSLMMRTALLKTQGFRLDAGIVADYDLAVRSLRGPSSVEYLPLPVAVCDAHGLSNHGLACIQSQYYRISRSEYRFSISMHLYYLIRYFQLFLIDLIRKVLPRGRYISLVRWLRRAQVIRPAKEQV